MATIALEDLLAPAAAIALGMARPMGLALVIPVFTRADVGTPIRAGFALALALPHLQPLTAALQAASPGMLRLGFLGVKEVLAGVLIGLLFGLPLWALQAAGELLDTQRSAPSSGGNDPGTGGQMSATAGLIGTTATTLFVAAGGLGVVASALYASFAVWPVLRFVPAVSPGAPLAALALIDGFSRTMVLSAAPVMLAMLMADAVVILVGKSVPKLGLFDLAATLRNLVFVGAMLVYGVFLMDGIAGQLALLRRTPAMLGAFLPGPGAP